MVPVGIWRPAKHSERDHQNAECEQDRAWRAEADEAPDALERIDRFLFAVVLDQLPELAEDLADTLVGLLFRVAYRLLRWRGHSSSLTSRHFLPGMP